MSRRPWLLLAILAAVCTGCAGHAPQAGIAADTRTTQDLRELRRQLLDAIDHGDRSALERILAPQFVFIHSTGVQESRQQFIDRTVASGSAAKSSPPPLVFSDEQIRIYGSTAIWTTRSTRPANGKSPDLNFRGTDVVVRTASGWQWASVHSTRLASRPAGVDVPASVLSGYVGEYKAGDRTLQISAQGATLYADLTGVRRAELVPQTETEFAWFDRDSNLEARLTFMKSADSHEAQAVITREGREVFRGARAVSGR